MSIKLPIYLDHQATTPIDPRVLEEMMPALTGQFGNAASRSHAFGWKAKELVDRARGAVAQLIGAEDGEIIFTSGATEAINLGLKGAAHIYREKGDHIITCVTEHKAVLDTCKALERDGFRITYLPVGADGRLSLDALRDAISDRTILVSVMHANNEVGVIQPVEEIGRLAHERGVLFFCDATQTVGKIPVDVNTLKIDLLSISAHKLYGPKGVGALYVRSKKPRVRLKPLIEGGGQENGLRSGTLNVPGIVGLGAACRLAAACMESDDARLGKLRDRLREGILSGLPHVYVNGSTKHRLSGNLNLSFAYVEGETLLTALSEDMAVSSGSACTSATLEPSYVLRAMGVGEDILHSSIRFGLGRTNTEAEIDFAIARVVETVNQLRALSPVYDMFLKSQKIKAQTEKI